MEIRLDVMPINKLSEIVLDEFRNSPKVREMAMQEIVRRAEKYEAAEVKIRDYLAAVENDERLSYPTAMVFENAPLALVQCGLESQRKALKLALSALA